MKGSSSGSVLDVQGVSTWLSRTLPQALARLFNSDDIAGDLRRRAGDLPETGPPNNIPEKWF